MYKVGEINRLKVLRKTDIGYMLESKNEEIFLHFNETNYQELNEGEFVDAFLYFDNKARLAATLKEPLITKEKPEILKVVDINTKLGLFLNMGIGKDLLLSKDDLPRNIKLWPKVGDHLYVTLEGENRLFAKLVNINDIKIKDTLNVSEDKDFFVQYIGNEGINLLSFDYEIIFIHNSLIREHVRLGELKNVKIINKTENGYFGSLIKQKEELRIDDSLIILNYLKKHKKMKLTSKSNSEDVKKIFNMSRKAFKRALGHLYKENKIDFKDEYTILLEYGDNNE